MTYSTTQMAQKSLDIRKSVPTKVLDFSLFFGCERLVSDLQSSFYLILSFRSQQTTTRRGSCALIRLLPVVFRRRMSGPQCCSNPPALNPASGGGRVEIVGGLDAYLVGPSEPKLAVVLVSDIFGFEAPKLRKLADKVASAGFYVVVPDFMHGEPYDPKNPERPIQAWLKDHGTDKGLEEVKQVIEALKSKGVAAIGAAGFCWGAKVVVGLAMGELVQAAVLLHPSLVTVDDVKGVKVPIAVLGAENDHMSPPELVKQFEEVLAGNPEVDAKVKIFPKVSHGWTVRYEDGDEFTIKSAEEAHEDMIGWFAKHVK